MLLVVVGLQCVTTVGICVVLLLGVQMPEEWLVVTLAGLCVAIL